MTEYLSLSQQQAKMLQFLQVVGVANRHEIFDGVGVSRSRGKACYDFLIFKGLITVSRVKRAHKYLFSITQDGELALRRHTKSNPKSVNDDFQITRAVSNTTNIFSFPVYKPPKAGYMRNTRHGHIPSKGTSA